MPEKNVGRKKKFTTEKLMEILDLYFENNKAFGQVTATDIARYATKNLGLKGIEYYHLNRDPQIKKILENTNNYSNIINENSKITFIPFDSDRFFDNYKNDPQNMRLVLRRFSNRYEAQNLKLIEFQNSTRQKELELDQALDEISLLKKELKKLKETNYELRSLNATLIKFKNLSDKFKMVEYLKDKGLITSLDEKNFLLLIKNTKLSSNDFVLELEKETQDVVREKPAIVDIESHRGNEEVTNKIKEMKEKLNTSRVPTKK